MPSTASVAVTVKGDVPMAVGVPLTTPPVESVRPGGNVPTVTANVNGAVPPLAVIVLL